GAEMIEIKHLNLAFGEGEKRNQVLDDVNISVKEGEIYGLVGESGSGKTTVLKCLAGLFTHWDGELAIDGKPLEKRISQERCRRVQMVFQDPYGSLHPRHTIGDILEEPLQIHGFKERDRRIHALLDKVGLNRAFRDRYPHQLSGGQRQRVAIARAL
ncbi:ABC transporter ATP-binding protein, partial [Staphylococcus aureus]|uniref:ABC transporter ATP-binding protein n=1 Tax=Staphylococcus aureus TaxID=1280 RepID=UPI003D1A0183